MSSGDGHQNLISLRHPINCLRSTHHKTCRRISPWNSCVSACESWCIKQSSIQACRASSEGQRTSYCHLNWASARNNRSTCLSWLGRPPLEHVKTDITIKHLLLSICLIFWYWVHVVTPSLCFASASSKTQGNNFTCIPWNLSFLYVISWKKDSKRCYDTITPESIHTKDVSKRGSAFAFIFGVNWPLEWI